MSETRGASLAADAAARIAKRTPAACFAARAAGQAWRPQSEPRTYCTRAAIWLAPAPKAQAPLSR
jgi:hypothetical protein